MAIFQKLKSLLGLGGSDSTPKESRDVGVTVEREHTREDEEPEPSPEGRSVVPSSVKETPSETDVSDEEETLEEEDDATDEDVADEEVADEDDETANEGVVEESEGVVEESEGVVEESEEDDDAVDAADEDAAAAETAESTPSAAEQEANSADGDPTPVSDIKGIGPAYADRLADADVESVADLANADAADLSGKTDISEKRLQGWIDRAKVR